MRRESILEGKIIKGQLSTVVAKETVFANHLSEKGLASRIHKEILHISNERNKITQIKKGKDLNKHFFEEEYTNIF